MRFERPPRLPVYFPCFGVSDSAGVPVKGDPKFVARCPGQDEWGCLWAKTETPNMGQVKGHPLEDIRKLASHRFPTYDQDERYDGVAAALDKADEEGKYISAGIFMVLFERMHVMHGFENTLMDLIVDRPAMEALADRIVEVQLNLVGNLARRFPGRIHGWSMTDDWGTQRAAFVRFDMWMDLFFPRYKRIFDAMHQMGCDVHVHSCGKVNEIIEGYIRAGVDCVNLQQPRALGIKETGDRYRGRIAFSSLSDIQQTLPTGDLRQVEADAEMLMTHWATPAGGFIFSDYGDDAAIGVPSADVKLHMYRCFSRHSERLYGQPLPEPALPDHTHGHGTEADHRH
jgi:hypothetical protein